MNKRYVFGKIVKYCAMAILILGVPPVLAVSYVFTPLPNNLIRVHSKHNALATDTVMLGGDSTTVIGQYLLHRNPILDELLPDGEGGTYFSQDLDSAAGKAYIATSTILIAPPTSVEGGENVELHERAHLLEGSLPHVTSRLLSKVGKPYPTEYAAKNSREHFAEMAANAWLAVMPPRGMCRYGSAFDHMRDLENAVPGTSGFVVWYLKHSSLRDIPGNDTILGVAQMLSKPAKEEWEEIYSALEARRLDDKTLAPWKRQTIKEYFVYASRHDDSKFAPRIVLNIIFAPVRVVGYFYDRLFTEV